MAAVLDACGVSVTATARALGVCRDRVHRYRTGRKRWPTHHFDALARLCGLPAAKVEELCR
jgi:hypothetical protein